MFCGMAVRMVRVIFSNLFNMNLVRLLRVLLTTPTRQYLMKELGWEDMKLRCTLHKLMFYYKIVNYLKELLPTQVFERTH